MAEDGARATAPSRDQPRGGLALLIIDMINSFDFPGADDIREPARRAAGAILELRDQAERAGVPVIYVNDNFGEWHSEKSRLVERVKDCLVRPEIAPDDKAYFVIKPQFSGFYATNLQVLLPKLGISRLVLTGVATDICILFTAADAHMRDYTLWVPEDAVASEVAERGAAALAIMRESMGADTNPVRTQSLADWDRRTRE